MSLPSLESSNCNAITRVRLLVAWKVIPLTQPSPPNKNHSGGEGFHAAVSGVVTGRRNGRSWRSRVNTYTATSGSTAITSTATRKPCT